MALAFSVASALVAMAVTGVVGSTPQASARNAAVAANPAPAARSSLVSQGKRTFRFDTFNDEAFWGGALHLHRAIAGKANGGVGPGVSPKTALAVGLKVDVDALPASVKQALKKGQVNLNDPAVTLALLKLNAVVGVKGVFEQGRQADLGGDPVRLLPLDRGRLGRAGRRAAARRLGQPRPERGGDHRRRPRPAADRGAARQERGGEVRTVLRGWGVGKFDAELLLDGKAEGPNGAGRHADPARLRPLRRQRPHLGRELGHGVVLERLRRQPRDAREGRRSSIRAWTTPSSTRWRRRTELFGHKRDEEDRISPKLPALHFYQLALPAPEPPAGSFDAAAAERGKTLFNGKAQCAGCHVPPTGSEPGWNFHTAEVICIDNFQADRAPDKVYRTSPLNGLWTHTKGGFFHDGRFPTLLAVVNHYDDCFDLGLTASEKNDLVEYLRSI